MEKIIDFLTFFDWSVQNSTFTSFKYDYWHNGISLIVGSAFIFFNSLYLFVDYNWSALLNQQEIISWKLRCARLIGHIYPILITFLAIQIPLGWGWLFGLVFMILGLIALYSDAINYYEDMLKFYIKQDNYKYTLIQKETLYNKYLES